MVKVVRLTKSQYDEIVKDQGHMARFFDVPSTQENAKFRGCYTDHTMSEIAVPWPVDRPQVAQQDFSDKYQCGWPVEEFDPKSTMN